MKLSILFRSRIERPAEEVFDWHLRPGVVERLLPPWRKTKFLSLQGNPNEEGFRVTFLMRIVFLMRKWVLQRSLLSPYEQELRETQIEGPFPQFEHTHRVDPLGKASCELTETIQCQPFFFASPKSLRRELERYCRWKHETLKQDLFTYERYSQKPLRLLVSGSSGFVGSSLIPFLRAGGHTVVRLVRSVKSLKEDAIYWDPSSGDVDKEQFEGFDAVIHLAGDNITSGRWTKEKKERIFLSRCRDTWLLSQVLTRLYQPPKTVICASAIGFYGNRGQELLTEKSPKGEGFLADVCSKWEAATEAIENRGSRVVHARFGAIISPKGGMLGHLMPLIRLGLGSIIGTGDQLISWVALDDLLGILYHLLMKETIVHAVNCVAPEVLKHRQYVQIVAKHLHRKIFFHLSEKNAERFFGEMAQELLLTSQNAVPKRLLETGYVFRYPTLDAALSQAFGWPHSTDRS